MRTFAFIMSVGIVALGFIAAGDYEFGGVSTPWYVVGAALMTSAAMPVMAVILAGTIDEVKSIYRQW